MKPWHCSIRLPLRFTLALTLTRRKKYDSTPAERQKAWREKEKAQRGREAERHEC